MFNGNIRAHSAVLASSENARGGNHSVNGNHFTGKIADEGGGALNNNYAIFMITSGIVGVSITPSRSPSRSDEITAPTHSKNGEVLADASGGEALGSVNGTNFARPGHARASPRRSQQVKNAGTDDIQLYRYKFHLAGPPDTNNSPTCVSNSEPSTDPGSQQQLVPVSIVEPPPALTASSTNLSTMAQQGDNTSAGVASFNKYPAPVFIKTVMSARANRIRRGLAEGAARRTRVNNDLRDELTRIIEFTAEQRNLQMRQQLLGIVYPPRKTPPVSAKHKGGESQIVSKTPEALRKKGYSDEINSLGPDGHPEVPAEIWPSSSVARNRNRNTADRSEIHARINSERPSSGDSSVITPPNSAAAGPVSSGRVAPREWNNPHPLTRANTPGSRLARGVRTPRSPQVPRSQSPGDLDSQQQTGASSRVPSSQRRRFIACVVSQNFALKLLQQSPRMTNSRIEQSSNRHNIINNYASFGIRQRQGGSYSRSFETLNRY